MRIMTIGALAGTAFISVPAAAQIPPHAAPESTAHGDSGAAGGADAPHGVSSGPADTSGAQGGSQFGPTAESNWKFSWNGYFRAPLRIGMGSRPQCPPGVSPAAQAKNDLAATQTALGAANAATVFNGVYCAAPGQGRTTFHSPYIPDDQYLAWNYTRQWEQAWAEVFLSYGNNTIKGTVGIQGYDFTDTSLLGNQAAPAQFGIGQGWVTVTPTLPLSGASMTWKVGAFWEKFGMAGRYDGGPYDTYMFGRTHQMGEALSGQYVTGDLTFRLEHGFGAHLEMTPAGIPIGGSQLSLTYYNSGATNNYPPGASPGYTLLNHVHAGVAYKNTIDFNVHYMTAWSVDDREQGTLGSSPAGGTTNTVDSSGQPDGSINVLGAEARVTAGNLGEVYLAYSHIDAKNVTTVGPAIEVLHSSGGGGHNGANGIYENFFNGVGNGTGSIDSVQVYYSDTFKLGFFANMRLALFGLYSSVSGTDATSMNLLTGQPTAGTQKLKYGADLMVNPLPWLGIGARGDYVQPDSHDSSESFGVVSPKIVFRTSFMTHEEITAQYSHYWDGVDVMPQQWLSAVGVKNIASAAGYAASAAVAGAPGSTLPGGYKNFAGPVYPNDKDVFGIKVTMWW
jgi:hypothetical protein